MEKRHGAALDDAPLVVVCSAKIELSLFLRHLLEGEGVSVEIAITQDDAFDRIVSRQAQLALIDGQLEGALELCRAVRGTVTTDRNGNRDRDCGKPRERERERENCRIVVLVEPAAVQSYAEFLSAGMDEGLMRPVEPGSILASVRRILRQARVRGLAFLSCGDLELDMPGRRVRRAGNEIRLTRIEFELLVLLAQEPMIVHSRKALIAGAWPKGVFVDPRTVNIHIGRLRRRLMEWGGSDVIRTVRGSGYALVATKDGNQEG